MTEHQTSIDVDVPVRTAYNQWTQFETFPQFMDGVTEVRQTDDKHLHWCVSIAGIDREWDAEITQQQPDERIAWKSTNGTNNAGVVTFHQLTAQSTRIQLDMDIETDGLVEKIGDMTGFVSHRIHGDLKRFKTFIEGQGSATGAWRDAVDRETGDVERKS